MSEANASELAVEAQHATRRRRQAAGARRRGVNVLISGVLSANAASGEILPASRDGDSELVVSEMLLTELTRTLRYPTLPSGSPRKAAAFINWVRGHGTIAEDHHGAPPIGSRDPDDDYLLALAIDRRAYLVTGDQDLLVLAGDLPILVPAEFAPKRRRGD